MTPEQIRHVQQSFEQIAPIADRAAALFYERLFAVDPALRPLFRGDLQTQGRMLMQTLALAVRSLHRPEAILPAVQQLGVRHLGYGVREQDYATVGGALLWTLEQGLASAFTDEVRAAWTEAYALLSGVMIAAARAAPSRAA